MAGWGWGDWHILDVLKQDALFTLLPPKPVFLRVWSSDHLHYSFPKMFLSFKSVFSEIFKF